MTKILISIRPEWAVKILNKKKTVEVRKSIPKCDLPCEVYIYCTKGKNISADNYTFDACVRYPYLNEPIEEAVCYYDFGEVGDESCLNGKVVAKFKLKKADLYNSHKDFLEVLEKVGNVDIEKYANGKPVYLWHISNLEIFEHPQTLEHYGLTKAPQSWCYIKKGNK